MKPIIVVMRMVCVDLFRDKGNQMKWNGICVLRVVIRTAMESDRNEYDDLLKTHDHEGRLKADYSILKALLGR